MSFGGTFENIETIGNKSKGYGNDPGPNGGWDGFNLENFGKDIEANEVDDSREDAENKIQHNVLIVINKTFEIRWGFESFNQVFEIDLIKHCGFIRFCHGYIIADFDKIFLFFVRFCLCWVIIIKIAYVKQ